MTFTVRLRSIIRPVIAFAVFAIFVPVLHAVDHDPSHYPLRVRLIDLQWHNHYYRGMLDRIEGFGRGNLTEGDKTQAFDYTFDCNPRPIRSVGDEFYPARWKKPEQTITILESTIGNENSMHDCDLKVSLHDFVYVRENGDLKTVPVAQYQQRRLGDKLVDTDISHYPLKISILAVDWEPKGATSYAGTGQANLADGGTLHAFDFAIACPDKIVLSAADHFYSGQWTKPNTSMALFTHKIGDETSVNICTLSTTMRSDVYVRLPTGAIAPLTPEQYAKQQQTPPAP